MNSSLPHGFSWRPPEDVRVDCQPPFLVDPLRRSPFELVRSIEQFRLETSHRFSADVTGPEGVPDGRAEPWCNLFIYDWLRAMGIVLPRRADGNSMRANELVTYFATQEAWRETAPALAVQYAVRLGWPVVVGWQHPEPEKSGHVAALRPPPVGVDMGAMYVAQAGRVRSSCLHIKRAFPKLEPLRFFVHE